MLHTTRASIIKFFIFIISVCVYWFLMAAKVEAYVGGHNPK